MVRLSKARPPAAAEPAGAGGGGASTEASRRSERLQQIRKRSCDTSAPSLDPALPREGRKRSRDTSAPSPDPALPRQGRKRSRGASASSPGTAVPRQGRTSSGSASPRSPDPVKSDEEIEGGEADDAEAEFIDDHILFLIEKEPILYTKRLYKKKANMCLVLYHKKNPEDCYKFASMRLKDIYNFMDQGVLYVHMNFKARDAATGSEKLFFAELAGLNNVLDENSGYCATACSIVDDNCFGGQRCLPGIKSNMPGEIYDIEKCYVCAERIKHPAGNTYRGGHWVEDYGIDWE